MEPRIMNLVTLTTLLCLTQLLLLSPFIEGKRPRSKRQHEEEHNYKPSFINSPLILYQHENTIEGFQLKDISQMARDDENDQLLYKLDTAGEEICTIGLTDGKLKLKIRPDREQKDEYTFQVIVSDSFEGGTNREAFLDVYLYILDMNDNKPIFKNTPYHVDISEKTHIEKGLINITATDNDASGPNKDIRYKFKGDEPKEFELHPNTGALTLRTPLDYERQTSYTLEVIAMDSGSPALTEQTKVVINVIDEDDTLPHFVLHQYNEEIKENKPIGSQIALVSARDGDTGINAEINYAIVGGDEYGLFKIDRKTGNVTVKGVLDREFYPKFTLTIEAYEATNVKSYTRINLNIKLTDENDNKPKFEKDHYNFELNEDEMNKNGLISRDIKATDEDATFKNNLITYWMEDNKYFEIFSETGALIQKGDLKDQDKDHFTFYVYAQESKTRERYKDKTSVDIHLNRSKRRPTVSREKTTGDRNSSSSKKDFVNKYLFTLAMTLCTLYLLQRELFL